MNKNAYNTIHDRGVAEGKKQIRDALICTLIGFQNEAKNDLNSGEYQAYQRVLEHVENTYGKFLS